MTDLERKLGELVTELRAQRQGGPRVLNSPPPDPNVPYSGMLGEGMQTMFGKIGGGLQNLFNTTGNYLDRAYQNSAGIQDLSEAVTKTLGQIPGMENISTVLGGMASALMDSYQNWQKFSGLGMQMGGDFMAFNTAFKRTGLTVEQYGEIFDKLAPAALNFGKGMAGGVQEFGRLMEMTQASGIAEQYKMLGMLPKDVNNAMITVIRSADTFKNALVPDALLKASLELAKQFDATAKLTGKSREEQEKTIETMQSQMAYNARLDQLRETNPEAAAAAGDVTKKLAALNPEVAKLFTEGFGGRGIFSTDAIYEFQDVYGPQAAARMTKLTRDMQSLDKATRDAAIQTADKFFGDLAEFSRNPALREMVANGVVNNRFAQARWAGVNNAEINYTKNVDMLMATLNISREEAKIRAEKIARLEGEGKVGILTEEMIRINATLKEPKYVVGQDNPDANLGRVLSNLEINQLRFNTGVNKMAETVEKSVTRLVDMDKLIARTASVTQTGSYKNSKGADVPILESNITTIMNAMRDEIRNMDNTPTGSADAIATRMEEKIRKLVTGNRTGTLGETGGEFFRNFGSGQLRMLHGMEGVFTPEQADAYASQKFSSIIPNLSSLFRNVETKVSSAMDSPVISKAIEQMATGADTAMNLSAEKLDAISNLLAANLQQLKEIARHTSSTSENVSNVSGYVS
jgi:hypothetical protein